MVRKRAVPLPMLAANLRRLRQDRGLTQEQLADAAEISSVKMIETGKNIPSVPVLIRLARVLDCSLGHLVSDPGEPLPEALERFLQTPSARDVSADEIEELKLVRARGKRPTETTYYLALQMLRSMERHHPT